MSRSIIINLNGLSANEFGNVNMIKCIIVYAHFSKGCDQLKYIIYLDCLITVEMIWPFGGAEATTWATWLLGSPA